MTMTVKYFIPGLAVCLATATTVVADPVLWKQLENWDVTFFDGLPGCAASAHYEGGTSVFIGLAVISGKTHLDLMFSDPSWESIEVGKEYEISIRFGKSDPWTVPMTGFGKGRDLRYTIPTDGDGPAEFIFEFMRKPSMSIYYGEREVGFYSLKGSSEAIRVMLECHESFSSAYGAMVGNSSGNGSAIDPFNSGKTSDPFN